MRAVRYPGPFAPSTALHKRADLLRAGQFTSAGVARFPYESRNPDSRNT